ncbi:MAG: hypothetical protein B6D65_00060 [candidate division Zixibacteria bacterium 4484_93]|nr:MAG: hypothetical protein B6D65_00060 [candidate division Zixibacteria bacterium 4484_93]
MKRAILGACLLLFLPVMIFAQAKVGTSQAQFLEIGPGARSSGMAGAFLGVADDITAIYYNPAGLARLTGAEFGAGYLKYPAGINYSYAAAAYPAFGGVIGSAFYNLGTDKMPVRNPSHPEGTGQTFSANDMACGMTYSRMLTDRFSVGITAKFIGEFYEDETAYGWAVDIGTFYQTQFKSLRLGMMLSNFGPDMKFIEQSYPIPMAFQFGMAAEVLQDANNRLTLSLLGLHPNDNLEKFGFGVEYAFREYAFLRAGYRLTGYSFKDIDKYNSEGFSFGGGISVPVAMKKVCLDYAYTDFGSLTSLHRVSFGFKF